MLEQLRHFPVAQQGMVQKAWQKAPSFHQCENTHQVHQSTEPIQAK